MNKAVPLLLTASLLALGCGVDEEPLRPRAGGPSRLAAMSLEERIAATVHQDEEWPPVFERIDAGSDGDAEADFRACRLSKLEDPVYLNSNGIVQAIALAKCMETKGWQVKEGAKLGE